jgi:hypothetical protein
MDKEALIKCVDTMIKIAVQLLSKKRQAASQSNRLPGVASDDDEAQQDQE